MLKKLSTFFIFLITIISIFHHSIIVFSHAEKVEHNHNTEGKVVLHHHHDNVEHDNHDIEEEQILTIRNGLDLTFESIKIIITKSYLDLVSIDYHLLENKNLVNNNSPPILKRKIKYYGYYNLTKIIKSNT